MTEQEKQEIIQVLKEELAKELIPKKSSLASFKPHIDFSNFIKDLIIKNNH